jgi:tRNA (guanine-N7-)-methyltransferase
MDEENASLHSRPIRTFVVRAGRMKPAQHRTIETLLPQYGIALGPRTLNTNEAFGREAPFTVEIGFGMGVATAEIALAAPEKNFLGIEVHPPGVANMLRLIAEQHIENVRVMQDDAVEIFKTMIAPGSVDAIHIYFPDPWHKARHHKRRMIQPTFTALLASRLKPGGYLHLATDWEPYAHWMLEVLSGEPALQNTAAGFCETKPAWRPTTKFETRGLNLGHGVWDLLFVRK